MKSQSFLIKVATSSVSNAHHQTSLARWPSRQPVIDRATILGGVNEHGDTLMPLWLEVCKREEANQTEITMAPVYLHVVRFLEK